jgi:hypothetical protein
MNQNLEELLQTVRRHADQKQPVDLSLTQTEEGVKLSVAPQRGPRIVLDLPAPLAERFAMQILDLIKKAPDR